MPAPTPFHPRTAALCRSLRWKDWAGHHAVCAYDTYPEREYFALRHAAGLIDVTPLHKYDVTGPGAAEALSRVMVRDVARLAVGRVTYSCWCDGRGKLLDDGTVWRLDDDVYRVTSAEPALAWLERHARPFDARVEDVGARVAALSLQGPRSRDALAGACDVDLAGLRFFRLARGTIGGVPGVVTRTGYTGDLGYEIWVDAGDALAAWDAVVEAGRPHGLEPAGLDAMDICRVEAGFILNGVDYFPANQCLIDARTATPYETALGWTVQLDRAPFVGQAALRAEAARGPARRFVGLEIDWDELEALFARHGLPPEICPRAWRDPIPVYSRDGEHVGQATSGAWSPTLKRNLALATVRAPYGELGDRLLVESTVEYVRHQITATVVEKPFFDPPRKRS